MPGRKPKPTALKKIDGTQKCRINFNEPEFRTVTEADDFPPPIYLSKVSQAKWKEVASLLIPFGLLTYADRDALTVYCEAWDRFLRACKDLRDNGNEVISDGGATKRSPSLSAVKEAESTLLRYQAEFGLTPASRSKLRMDLTGKKSELEEFLDTK
jgi:P27 family predicted phage terminase small subunit